VFFLFSDILIYASLGLLSGQFVFHRAIPLFDIHEIVFDEKTPKTFQIISAEKSFAVNTDESREWVDAIRNAIGAIAPARLNQSYDDSPSSSINLGKPPVVEFSAPLWIPDIAANECMSCLETFSLFRRRHHCRACGNVVCYACSSNVYSLSLILQSFLIPQKNGQPSELAKACDVCIDGIISENRFTVVSFVQERPSVELTENKRMSFSSELNKRMSQCGEYKRTSQSGEYTRRMSQIGNNPRLSTASSGVSSSTDFLMRAARTSIVYTRNPGSFRECSLCRDRFGLFKWKFECKRCERPVCYGFVSFVF
jgi:hypothetical protein